jgi:hypothetical protein
MVLRPAQAKGDRTMNTYHVLDEITDSGYGYGVTDESEVYWEGMYVRGDLEDGSGLGFGVDFTIGEGDGSDSYGWGPDWGPSRWANFK